MDVLETALLNSLCEVKSADNVLLATGILTACTPSELTIHDPCKMLSLIRFNRPVKIYVHANDGGREFLGRVYISTNNLLRIKDVHLLSSEERRSSFRVAVALSGKAYRFSDVTRSKNLNRLRQMDYATRLENHRKLAGVEELSPEQRGEVAKPLPTLPTAYPVQIVDMSATGIRFQANEAFRPRERLLLHFTLLDKPAQLACTPMREPDDCSEENASLKASGCKFLNITAEQNSLLCTFLLHEQGKQIQHSRSM